MGQPRVDPQEVLTIAHYIARKKYNGLRATYFHACIDYEDIVSAGVLRVYRDLPRWREDGGASVKSWIYMSAARGMMDYLRTVKNGGRHTEAVSVLSLDNETGAEDGNEPVAFIDITESNDAPLDSQVFAKDFWRTVGELEPRLVLILHLYFRHGVSQSEIAELLGVTESRVCQLKKKGLTAVQSRMQIAA